MASFRLYFGNKQATTNKTLAADAGSYAITGTAASILHKWIVTAGAGSYTITGTAASIFHKWIVTAGVGSYTITGTDATITVTSHSVTLAADPGSYLITGTDATITPTFPAAVSRAPVGGAFTRRPDRRLTLQDLREHFSAEQEALDRALRAKGKREREAMEAAAAAASAAMRAAIGQDDGIEPELAAVARKLRNAVSAKRVNHAVRLANEAAAMARAIGYELDHGAQARLDEDDEEAAFVLL